MAARKEAPAERGRWRVVTAEKLLRSIAEAWLLDRLAVTVSIGIAGLRPDDSVEEWVRATDDAMYAAKQAGRNRVARREAARSGTLPRCPRGLP